MPFDVTKLLPMISQMQQTSKVPMYQSRIPEIVANMMRNQREKEALAQAAQDSQDKMFLASQESQDKMALAQFVQDSENARSDAEIAVRERLGNLGADIDRERMQSDAYSTNLKAYADLVAAGEDVPQELYDKVFGGGDGNLRDPLSQVGKYTRPTNFEYDLWQKKSPEEVRNYLKQLQDSGAKLTGKQNKTVAAYLNSFPAERLEDAPLPQQLLDDIEKGKDIEPGTYTPKQIQQGYQIVGAKKELAKEAEEGIDLTAAVKAAVAGNFDDPVYTSLPPKLQQKVQSLAANQKILSGDTAAEKEKAKEVARVAKAEDTFFTLLNDPTSRVKDPNGVMGTFKTLPKEKQEELLNNPEVRGRIDDLRGDVLAQLQKNVQLERFKADTGSDTAYGTLDYLSDVVSQAQLADLDKTHSERFTRTIYDQLWRDTVEKEGLGGRNSLSKSGFSTKKDFLDYVSKAERLAEIEGKLGWGVNIPTGDPIFNKGTLFSDTWSLPQTGQKVKPETAKAYWNRVKFIINGMEK